MKPSLHYVFASLTILFFTGCASLNKPLTAVPKSVGPQDQLVKRTEGKTPKEVKQIVGGDPFMVGFLKNASNKYWMAFPSSDGPITSWDVMTSKGNISCIVFEFKREDNFKMGMWYDNSCELIKDDFKGYDDSLLK